MAQGKFERVCSREVQYTIDQDGLLRDISFVGGCEGNLKAIARLLEGKPATEAVALMEGNTCGNKNTSCTDQFAQVLKREVG